MYASLCLSGSTEKLILECRMRKWPPLCLHFRVLGPVSISEKTSFRKISWSLEAARFVFGIVRSLWNLTGTSAAVLPMGLSNFKAIRLFKVPIPWLRHFTRSYGKTSFRILRRGPDNVTVMSYEHHDVSNHRHSHCLSNRLFRRISKKTSKVGIICPL